MECFRQTLNAVYFALADAAGGQKVLDQASKTFTDAIDAGAVDDPDAVQMLKELVHHSQPLEHDPHGCIISLCVPQHIARALDAAAGETLLSPAQVALHMLDCFSPEAQPCL
jgi:hypothetical protein